MINVKQKSSFVISQLIMLVFSLVLSQSVPAGVAVIVNSASSINSAEPKEIKKIFLGKSKSISDQPVKPIDNTTNDVRNTFLGSIVKKNPRAFKSYWTRLVFSGKAAPLKRGIDDASVKKWVNEHHDSIGFIDSRSVDSSVKVIFETK